MRREGLQAIAPQRFTPRTTNSRHDARISPNLLTSRPGEPQAAGLVIVGGHHLPAVARGRWCYLATFQDKVTRRVVGWAMESRMTADLVVKALGLALRRGLLRGEALVPTDRGSQYVSDAYRELLGRHGLQQSMSGCGNCYDNAQAESFFSRFKAELGEQGVFESVTQARSETFSYLEGYYNRVRLHSSLGVPESVSL